LKYHVVGGFSFYERSEIKDMISYLKIIHNPDDSISLLRVINTPTRGVGKGTIDTLERLALETGLSLWGAIGEAIRRQLLPQRALSSLQNFQHLIEDARAMLAGTFAERLDQSVARAPSPASADIVTESAEPSNETQPEDATAFDPSEFGNFSFDFGAEDSELAASEVDSAVEAGRLHDSRRDAGATTSGATAADATTAGDAADAERPPEPEIGATADSFPTPTVSTADILKFLIDRTGYIKLLEEEDTPEAFSRIENLRELVNAAMDSRDRGETLDEFLDHAALVADADDYDERAQITLMSLHAAKGLEFPLIFLSGLEEGLFPHSRTMLVPEDIEEERRLCYVGMTRAMDQLILTRAVYRRRYGTDLPEASVPSRFLEEVPAPLIEELGTKSARMGTNRLGTAAPGGPAGRSAAAYSESTHYSYEDEDQSAAWHAGDNARGNAQAPKPTAAARAYNSIENIAEFFASRGKKFTVSKPAVQEPTGKRGFRPGQKVRHPKYGEGTVYQREGEGEEAKITVQFPRFGLKKLVEKYAQLERA
jgi:ATP-dependent DNA helicase UvrD/PcrA